MTTLGGHFGVQKLTHALFQRVWWPKLHETVIYLIHLYTTYGETKNSTTVPPGLLQPLLILESSFSSWSIGFTTDLPLSHEFNTIIIPCKMGDKRLSIAGTEKLSVYML